KANPRSLIPDTPRHPPPVRIGSSGPMTKTRRLMVVVGAALLCHGSAVAGEPQSPSAAASPSALLERLAALRPSPAALIEPPVGFSTTTPFGDLVVIAELTAEIERRAQDGNDPEA